MSPLTKENVIMGSLFPEVHSNRLSHSPPVVKKKTKVRKKTSYKRSPQDPTQTSMGEKENRRNSHNSSNLCRQYYVVLKDRI